MSPQKNGEGGIRTHEQSPVKRFRIVRFRPLSHLSINKAEAIKLLEFLASPEGSKGLAAPTFEHPLKEVNQNQIVKNFGEFTPDEVSVKDLGNNNSMALMMMKEAGWD